MSSGVAGEQVTDHSLLGVPCLGAPEVDGSADDSTAGSSAVGGSAAGDGAAEGSTTAERVASIAAEVAALHEDLAADVAWRLGEADLLQVTGTLVRLRAGLDAAYLRAVAEVDRRRAGAPAAAAAGAARASDGPRGARSGIGSSTESFLRTSAPLTPAQARSDVAAARALGPTGSLRELEPQLAVGDITRAHVDVAVRCLDAIPVHLRTEEADRVTIADYFATLAPTRHALQLKHNGAVLLQRLAPEAVERFDPASHERRFLDWTTDATGMLLGRFALDPAAGATLRTAIDAASAPRPTEDGVRDDRQARERRADALVQVADTALGVTGPVRGENPRIVVHATADQLTGLTPPDPGTTGGTSPDHSPTDPASTDPASTGHASTGPAFFGPAWTEAGTHLHPHTVRRLACDAVLQRVVLQRVVRDRDGRPLGSEQLDLGRTARLADVHLRRALAARDRGCIIPGCGAPPAHCDAHHIVHWADGGPTTLTNTTQLCGSHHTAVHDGTWQIRMGPDGIPEAIPPRRIDPYQRPRRAPHHDTDDLLRRTERHRPEPDDPDVDPPEEGAPSDPSPPTGPGAPSDTSPPHPPQPHDTGMLGEPGHGAPRRVPPDDDWRPPGWDPDQPYPF